MIVEIDLAVAVTIVVLLVKIEAAIIYAIVRRDWRKMKTTQKEVELMLMENDIDSLLRRSKA